jgi:plastocyanin
LIKKLFTIYFKYNKLKVSNRRIWIFAEQLDNLIVLYNYTTATTTMLDMIKYRKENHMQKDRTARILVVVAICIATLGLSFAYSAFSTTLDIAGTATVKGSQWSVYFTNLQSAKLTGQAKSTKADITTSTTKFDFSVELVKPGDSVSYTFDVINAGAIDAKLSSITITGVDDANASNVTYTLTKEDGSVLAVNDALASGDSQTLLLTVTYDETAEDVPEADITLNLGAVLTYTQS